MTPEEVRLIVKGWQDNHSQLALLGQLPRLSIATRCRVAGFTDGTFHLETGDGGRIVVEFSRGGARFKYAEPREFPQFSDKVGLTHAQQFASSLMILFSEDDKVEDECLFLMELVD